MTSAPRVSVVTIFLNAERFIEDAFRSVLAQTHDDWELLLVDDGSTDSSTGIARDLAARHAGRVLYLDHPGHENRGMSASRNLGIRKARGRWLGLLDADDVWLPQKLEEQLALLEAEPQAAMIYGRTLYWWDWAGSGDSSHRDRIQNHGITGNSLYQPPELLEAILRGHAAVPCTCSVLARRQAIEEIGGFEEGFPSLYEDQVFYAKMFLHFPILVSDHCWDKYRQHERSSTMRAASTEERAARLEFLDWLAGYVSATGWEGTGLGRALRLEHLRARRPLFGRTIKALRRLRGTGPRQIPVTPTSED